MGYNGNNRGRTHNWSGVGNKSHYNWGLNLTAKALVAPFALLFTLIEIADDLGAISSDKKSKSKINYVSPPKRTPAQPHDFIKSLAPLYPEITQRIALLSKKENELLSLKSRLQSVRHNYFLFGKRKRIIRALNYRISKKQQFISSFQVFDEKNIGKPLESHKILGKVAVHFSDQSKEESFREGIVLNKQLANFYKGINKTLSLSLKGDDWQMVLYSKGILFEDSNNMLFVPYKDITAKETWVTHYAGWNDNGYDVQSMSWMYPRRDGGPDLRYSNNGRIYYVQRYQVELKFKKLEKDTSIYIVFQKNYDSKFLCKKISPRIKYDPEKIKKIKKYGSRIF